MSVGASGQLTISGGLPSAAPCTAATCVAPNANTWVRGYPSVLYGLNQCNAQSSPPPSPKLPLPWPLSASPSHLIGTTAYTSYAPRATYDVAYDLWLNDSDTKTPCRTNGTVEVMVWTDYDAKALLPRTMQVATGTVPYAVDGVVHAGDQAWSVYASNVYQGGRTAPWGGTIWLVLNQADIVSHGTVSIDLSRALTAVGSLLQTNYGWTNFESTYWLDTIPFGMEFGPSSGASNGADSAYFSLTLSSYCITLAASVSTAGC